MLRRTSSSSPLFFPTSSGFIPKEVFVIVGGLSTGRHIAPMFNGYGYSSIHVMPKRAQSLGIKHKETDYIASFTEEDDNTLIKQLEQFHIRAIIPGCEAGVDLADRLNE